MIAKYSIENLYLKYNWNSLQRLSSKELQQVAEQLNLPNSQDKYLLTTFILQKILSPSTNINHFRSNLIEYLPTRDVIQYCIIQDRNDPPFDCSKESSWYQLIKRDFNITYDGPSPKDYYLKQVVIHLSEDDDNSVWRVIEYVVSKYGYMVWDSEIKGKIWEEMYEIKEEMSEELVRMLNKNYTRLANRVFEELWNNMDKLGKLYKFPEILYFTDYIMALGKLNYYLFMEDVVGMIVENSELYMEGKEFRQFGNFFLTRMEPGYFKKFF